MGPTFGNSDPMAKAVIQSENGGYASVMSIVVKYKVSFQTRPVQLVGKPCPITHGCAACPDLCWCCNACAV